MNKPIDPAADIIRKCDEALEAAHAICVEQFSGSLEVGGKIRTARDMIKEYENGQGAMLKDLPFDRLEFSVRAVGILKAARSIETIGDLADCTEEWLRAQPRCGTRTIKEIKELLSAVGLGLTNE